MISPAKARAVSIAAVFWDVTQRSPKKRLPTKETKHWADLSGLLSQELQR